MNKVLFLDRDGIINIDLGYVHKIEDFHFMPDIFNVCKHAKACGYLIIVITNQSGIARGYYSEEQFSQLSEWMIKQFNDQDIDISDVLYCPHHPTKGQGSYKLVCNCRKPQPGLLLQAQERFNIDMEKSIFIGDKNSDIAAAFAAGIKNRILLEEKNSYLDNLDAVILSKKKEKTQLISKNIISEVKEAIKLIN